MPFIRSGFLLGITALCLFSTTPAHAAAPIAEVASVKGVAEAIATDGSRRMLAHGDVVYAGERVVSGSGSSAGLWLDTALAQLDEKSRVRFSGATDARARVEVEEGAVRVVDPRRGGLPIELVALDATTRVAGGDSEARILREKTGPYAILCDWEEPISVARAASGGAGEGAGGRAAGERRSTDAAGNCIVANQRESLFEAPAHANRISLLEGAPSLADAGPAIDVAQLIGGPGDLLPSVASGGGFGGGGGGLASAFAGGALVAGFPREDLSPCGTINGGCSGALGGDPGGPPTTLIEQPPTTSPFPGTTQP